MEQVSLSPLGGGRNETYELDVIIRENQLGEAVSLSGLFWEADHDIEGASSFFLQIEMHTERFRALLKELTAPGAVLNISARADRFENFYAAWSPSISEGRVIKFLDSKSDVENADEIADDFWRTPEFQRELVSNPDNPPVKIVVGRPVQAVSDAEANDRENEEEEEGFPARRT